MRSLCCLWAAFTVFPLASARAATDAIDASGGLEVVIEHGADVEAVAPDADASVVRSLPTLTETLAENDESADTAEAPVAFVVAEDEAALLLLAKSDVPSLGPLSVGTPDAGLLVNPIPMPEGPLWTIRDPDESWGTAETVGFVVAAITAVEARHPGSPRLVIGDISHPGGGRLNRHRSHQAGRDVDLGFYYVSGECGEFRDARRAQLDRPRSWALLRALLTETDVERIFLDRSLQRILYAHALEEGEDRAWLDDVFGRVDDPEHKGIIQHEKRHRDHLHVRFFNRTAQERARIVYPTLVAAGSVPPPLVKHRVRRGETLGHLAARYGTSVSAIRSANRMRGNMLRAGRAYVIPVRRVPPDNGPIVVPERRLPPGAQALVGAPGSAGDEAPVIAR